MDRVFVRLQLHDTAPPLLRHLPEADVCSPFGRWVRGRIGSIRLDWPMVAIDRITLYPHRCELEMIPHDTLRPLLAAMAVGRAIALEVGCALERREAKGEKRTQKSGVFSTITAWEGTGEG